MPLVVKVVVQTQVEQAVSDLQQVVEAAPVHQLEGVVAQSIPMVEEIALPLLMVVEVAWSALLDVEVALPFLMEEAVALHVPMEVEAAQTFLEVEVALKLLEDVEAAVLTFLALVGSYLQLVQMLAM